MNNAEDKLFNIVHKLHNLSNLGSSQPKLIKQIIVTGIKMKGTYIEFKVSDTVTTSIKWCYSVGEVCRNSVRLIKDVLIPNLIFNSDTNTGYMQFWDVDKIKLNVGDTIDFTAEINICGEFEYEGHLVREYSPSK